MKIKLPLLSFYLFILSLFFIVSSRADNFVIANSSTNFSSWFDSVTIDANGNIYAAGAGDGPAGASFDVDPSPFNDVIVNELGETMVIVKYSPKGELIWHRVLGNSDGLSCTSIAVDPTTQDIVLTGNFILETDFDPGAGSFVLNAPNDNTGFVLRLDSNGNFVWVKRIGGSLVGDDDGSSDPKDLAFDSNGNILITGTFRETCDFNPDFFGLSYRTAQGSRDMFVLKLNPAGNFLWVHIMVSDNDYDKESAEGIAIDSNDNICVTGYFNSIVDFDTDQGGFDLEPLDDIDVFVLKLDEQGDGIWVKKIGGYEDDKAFSIVCDYADNIVFGGTFEQQVDFNPDAGNYSLWSSNVDVFVAKWNSNGNFIWAKQIKGPGAESLVDLSKDITPQAGGENIYFTGRFISSVDFDPGVGTNSIQASAWSPYVVSLTGNGAFRWASAFLTQQGNGNYTRSSSLAINTNGAVVVVGTYQAIDLDPGIGLAEFTKFNFNGSDGYFCVSLDGQTGLLRANSAKFDASLDTDIVFQHQINGSSAIWLMDGTAKVQDGITIDKVGFVPSTNWQIAAVGDFNKDLQSDVVMQNRTNGVVQVWFLNSVSSNKVTVKSWFPVATVTNLSWKVVAAGEFNNDGNTDIVWQNTQSGICLIWYMYGAEPYDDELVTVLPTEWQVVGTGWFDNNEGTDLIWQNKVTKERVIWTMNGAIADTSYSFGSAGNWEFVGSGFFNDDNRSDVILENKGTQQRTVWLADPANPVPTLPWASALANFSEKYEAKNR